MQPPSIDYSLPEPRVDASPLGRIEAEFRHLSAQETVLDLNRIGISRLARFRHVRRLLAHPAISYEQRDTIWRDVLWFTRPDLDAIRHRRQWRKRGMLTPDEWMLTALGLAMPGLRHALRTTLGNPGPDERDDVHADLIAGFLDHLTRIDTRRRNICGRLIAAAVRRARAQQTKRQRHRTLIPLGADQPDTGDGGIDTRIDLIATWQRLHQLPLHPTDRQLIALTRLQGHTLTAAAQALGLTLTAATSRRDRAEQRLAAYYRQHHRRSIQRPQPHQLGARIDGTAD